MKLTATLLLAALLLTALSGCRGNVPQDTHGSITPSTGQTESSQPSESAQPPESTGEATANTRAANILQTVWDSYPEGDRFSAYGGRVEMAVNDGPGDLDVTNTEEMTTRYLLPQDQLSLVTEGASLSHLMNSNIFTAVVLRMKDSGQSKALADAWRSAIRNNHWICGQPDRLLLVQADKDHVLMAFGSQELLPGFEEKLKAAFPDSQILYKEAIVA